MVTNYWEIPVIQTTFISKNMVKMVLQMNILSLGSLQQELGVITAASLCDQVRMNYQSFQPKEIQMMKPNGPLPVFVGGGSTHFDLNYPNYLELKILDGDGHSLLADPQFPLDLQAEVTEPNGSTQLLTFIFQSTEEETWKSNEALPVDQLGEYKISITGAEADCAISKNQPEHCPAPHRFTIFDLDTLPTFTYTTGNVNLFHIQVVAPMNSEELPIHGSLFKDKLALQPIIVKANLQANGQLVPFDQAMSGDPNQALKVKLQYENSILEKTMQVNSATPGEFIAEFTDKDVISNSGQYKVIVSLANPKNYNNLVYRPESVTAEVSFSRQDPPLRNIYVLGAILAALLIAIAAIILIWMDDRSRALRGQLIFSLGQNSQPPLNIGSSSRKS